jgi:hypothetical protein
MVLWVVARISGVGAVKSAMAIVRARAANFFHGKGFTATSIAEKSRMQDAAERFCDEGPLLHT